MTDTNGRISISDLEPGVYSVKEIAAPSGYVLNGAEYHVELFPGKDSTLVVNNEKKPNLKIVKTDAVTGAPLSGVTFTVNKADSITKDPIKGAKFHITYASNNSFTGELNDLGTYFTDENGQVKLTKLRDGWYRVTEVEPAAATPSKTRLHRTASFRQAPARR